MATGSVAATRPELARRQCQARAAQALPIERRIDVAYTNVPVPCCAACLCPIQAVISNPDSTRRAAGLHGLSIGKNPRNSALVEFPLRSAGAPTWRSLQPMRVSSRSPRFCYADALLRSPDWRNCITMPVHLARRPADFVCSRRVARCRDETITQQIVERQPLLSAAVVVEMAAQILNSVDDKVGAGRVEPIA